LHTVKQISSIQYSSETSFVITTQLWVLLYACSQSLIPKLFLTDSVFHQHFSLCYWLQVSSHGYTFHYIVCKTIRPSHKMKLVEKTTTFIHKTYATI